MSTFKGIMKEYPFIAADYFKGDTLHPSISAYFLSHCHRDHMVGLAAPEFLAKLKSRNDINLYCTSGSACLLRNDYKYKHLDPYVVPVEYDNPILLSLTSTKSTEVFEILVTFMPAGHCVGSAMILLEGPMGNVLYTGDIRIAVGEIQNFTHLHTDTNQLKLLKSMYLDTTFCRPAAFHIPNRSESLEACVNLIRPWLSENPQHFVWLICPAQYGYEHLFCGLHKQLGMKVFVGPKKYAKYEGLPECQAPLTPVKGKSRIALCIRREPGDQGDYDSDNSDDDASPKKDSGNSLKIKLSAMWYTRYTSITDITRFLGHNFHRVCYSTHSSLEELQYLVNYLQPENIYPNVLGSEDTGQMIYWLRSWRHTPEEGMTQSDEENDLKPGSLGNHVPFGKLKLTLPVNEKSGDNQSVSSISPYRLDFGSSPNNFNNEKVRIKENPDSQIEKVKRVLYCNEKEFLYEHDSSDIVSSQTSHSYASNVSDSESIERVLLDACHSEVNKKSLGTAVINENVVGSSSPEWCLQSTPTKPEEKRIVSASSDVSSQTNHESCRIFKENLESMTSEDVGSHAEEIKDRDAAVKMNNHDTDLENITYKRLVDGEHVTSSETHDAVNQNVNVITSHRSIKFCCDSKINSINTAFHTRVNQTVQAEVKESLKSNDKSVVSDFKSGLIQFKTSPQDTSNQNLLQGFQSRSDIQKESSVMYVGSQLINVSNDDVKSNRTKIPAIKRTISSDDIVCETFVKRKLYSTDEHKQTSPLLDCTQESTPNLRTLEEIGTNSLSVFSKVFKSRTFELSENESPFVADTNTRNCNSNSSDVLFLTDDSSELGSDSNHLYLSQCSSKDSVGFIDLVEDSNSLPLINIDDSDNQEDNLPVSSITSHVVKENTPSDSDATPEKIVVQGNEGNTMCILPQRFFKDD